MFHETRFPTSISFGAIGGPERQTSVVQLSNGFEERRSSWRCSRRRYDAGIGAKSLDDIEEMVAFFEARHGRLYGFRWKDWSDYKSCSSSQKINFRDQIIGYGDGTAAKFPIIKKYSSGQYSYLRRIHKPVEGTVLAGIQADEQVYQTHYSVDYASGEITFVDPPPDGSEISCGFEFDVPVRFDSDSIKISISNFAMGEIPNIPILELRL